jgi:signal transduction histidine kinase
MNSINWQFIFNALILSVLPVVVAGVWIFASRRGNSSGQSALLPAAHTTLIDRLEAAAFILDLNGKIAEINLAAAKLCAIGKEQAKGQTLSSLLPWWEEVERGCNGCIELQKDVQVMVSGLKRQYNVQITPIWDQQQNLTGRLVLIRYLMAEKITEGVLSLTSVRAEFLAKVSHELRTPLTSILGISEMLDYGVYGPLSREQKEALRLISDSSQQMVRLVNDLLEQTRLEQGALQLDIADFVMDDLIDRLRVNTIYAARAKGLSLEFEIEPDVPSIVRGDALRLYQILRNLVDNAIKYTNQGQVKVRVYSCGRNRCAFEVSDTGIGIPKEQQSLIYQPFLRIYPQHGQNGNGKGNGNGNGNGHSNGNGYRQTDGFGLGLSIVKQLVTLMGGEIELDSEVNRGSIFTVKLPLEAVSETVRSLK